MVDILANRHAEIEILRLSETLVEVETKAPMDTLFETRQETLPQVNIEELFDKLCRKESKCSIRHLLSHCKR